jgi:hypothetical protein
MLFNNFSNYCDISTIIIRLIDDANSKIVPINEELRALKRQKNRGYFYLK